jgi:trehalose 6-phosphate phosphatase
VQHGNKVCELKSPGPSMGDAVRAFLNEVPFLGSIPVFIGDDMTDEDGFLAARQNGGFGVLVGEARKTHATFRLDTIADVLDWLTSSVETSR